MGLRMSYSWYLEAKGEKRIDSDIKSYWASLDSFKWSLYAIYYLEFEYDLMASDGPQLIYFEALYEKWQKLG